MYFEFALDASDIDFLDTDFDLLDADIPSKDFVCLQDVFKICLQDFLKACLEDVLKMSSA